MPEVLQRLLCLYSDHQSEERSERWIKETFKGYLNGLQKVLERYLKRGAKMLLFLCLG